jgi:tetratricopeptide (TPR) repeat protein
MLALASIKAARYPEAMEQLRLARQPPPSLGADDFTTIQSPRLLFFEALAEETHGGAGAARKAWAAAAQTTDDDPEREGLFRAIARYKLGETKPAEEWFHQFTAVNDRRKSSASAEIRLYSYYLGGIYAAFRGDDHLAQQNFQKTLEIDQSNLFARQAQTWLAGDILKTLRSSSLTAETPR